MTPPSAKSERAAPEWARSRERGSSLLLGVVVWCIRKLGSAPIRPLVFPIALYYCLFDGYARRASEDYLVRVGARKPDDGFIGRRLHTYRHFRAFAEVILERLSLWSGAYDDFNITIHGHEHVLDLVKEGRSGFMVGAHIGSFDVLRVLAQKDDIPVNVLMFSANAELINTAIESLAPNARIRIIDIDVSAATSASMALRIRECIESGEFVATMADRVDPGGRGRITEVDFLGDRAPLSQGPFLLAMILKVPVILTLALRTGPRQYDIFFENIGCGTEKEAGANRRDLIDAQIQSFSNHLEVFCRQAPLQWFNFYDFWNSARK